MRARSLAALALAAVMVLGTAGFSSGAVNGTSFNKGRFARRTERTLPKGFRPAAVRKSAVGRYFVVMKAPVLADQGLEARKLPASAQRSATTAARSSQAGAISAVETLGGEVALRYDTLLNGFSARLSLDAAGQIAQRPDVQSVQPVSVVVKANETSVPFIGATQIHNKLGVRGQGMTVAVVDTGVDYTHADFGGPGTVAAYDNNDPTIVEPGTFPTNKVIAGFDVVGGNYDVLDDSPANDMPVPDPDPLDVDGHGTHVAGTCCGNGVEGVIGKGVAPRARIIAVKVWDVGNSTDDVLVAGYERAVDPNDDGSLNDSADVLSFSGGVDYGSDKSVEAHAAQNVVKTGVVFVAAAGNAGNQAAGLSGYIAGTPGVAPGVISVAASIDSTLALQLQVNSPQGVSLPFDGVMVHQGWSPAITADATGDVVDAREFFPPADPDGVPASSDVQFCDPAADNVDLSGQIALIFKGSIADGDCDGSLKVFNAQEAGAMAVILWSGFTGPPFALDAGEQAENITIPAVMVAGSDGEALGAAASPDAPASYNTGGHNVTVDSEPQFVDSFTNWMADFSSEGPARGASKLKPDITAPGVDITSAGVGSGDGPATISGTSMATPHISGVAALMLQIHPKWPPAKVKAVIMNQATRNMTDAVGSGFPVPATVMGSGLVQAFDSAKAKSLAQPGSLSFKVQKDSGTFKKTRSFEVRNLTANAQRYEVSGNTRYTDYADDGVATVEVAAGNGSFGESREFSVGAHRAKKVRVRLTVDTSGIDTAEELFGWYYFNPGVDGVISVQEQRGREDRLGVPWHVIPLAASNDAVSQGALDLTDGSDTLGASGSGSGQSQADLYLLGAEDPAGDVGPGSNTSVAAEADILHAGARTFAGSSIDGASEGVPEGVDALGENSYLGFLTSVDEPTELVEFGLHMGGVANTTETLDVSVLIDAGNDGDFADPELAADFILEKVPFSSTVCLFDLSSATPDECAAEYFMDYSVYNSNVVGIPVDAGALGLSDANSEIGYQVVACTGTFSGDVPGQLCDTAGDFVDGNYTATLDVANPSLVVSPLVCGGYFGGADCSGAESVGVTVGSAAAGDDPSLLVLFPNNEFASTATVVTTDNG